MNNLLKVVLIEDEPLLLRELLETFSWRSVHCKVVGTAVTASHGQQLIESLRPDLVITDIRLPDSDGLTLIKTTNPKAAIVITGHSQISYAQQAIRCGVIDFLVKPLDDQELRDAIKRVHEFLNDVTLNPVVNPEADSMNSHVQEALLFIRRRYQDNVSLLEAAEDLGISEGHLSVLFKTHTGQTFVQALTAYRLNMARILLADPRNSVAAVSRACGFNDAAYFSRQFQRHFAMSPSAYRNKPDIHQTSTLASTSRTLANPGPGSGSSSASGADQPSADR
jgi:two-component system response regulator YesN